MAITVANTATTAATHAATSATAGATVLTTALTATTLPFLQLLLRLFGHGDCLGHSSLSCFSMLPCV